MTKDSPRIILRAYSARALPAFARIPLERYFNALLPALGLGTALEVVEDGWVLFVDSFWTFKTLYTPSPFREEINQQIERELAHEVQNECEFAWEFRFDRVPADHPEEVLATLVEAYYAQPGGIEDAHFTRLGPREGKQYYRVVRPSMKRYMLSINLSIDRIVKALGLENLEQEKTKYLPDIASAPTGDL